MNDGITIRIQGIRVLWNKAPYNKSTASAVDVATSRHQPAVTMRCYYYVVTPNMRGDYYVVPPNSAHVGRCVRESLACAHASGPEAIEGWKLH